MLQRIMSEQNSDNISSSVEQLLTSQRLVASLRARPSGGGPESGPLEKRRSSDSKSGGMSEKQGGSEGSNGDAVASPGTPDGPARINGRKEETSSFESAQSANQADSAALQPGPGRSESQSSIMAMVGRPPSSARDVLPIQKLQICAEGDSDLSQKEWTRDAVSCRVLYPAMMACIMQGRAVALWGLDS